MSRNLFAASLAASLALAPLACGAQEVRWNALAVAPDGVTGAAQNQPTLYEARSTALATCWNHSRTPKLCAVGSASANLWLVAVRCIHRAASGFAFTRTEVNGGSNLDIALSATIHAVTQDGNVYPSDCRVVRILSGTGTPPAPDLNKTPA